jgi:hypothetical protein
MICNRTIPAVTTVAALLASPASADEQLTIWGDNSYGQADVPSWVVNPVHVGCTRRTVAVVMPDGTIGAWGYDANGEVSSAPFPDPGVSFEKVFGGWGFTFLGLTNQGQLVSWGRNSVGQANVPALPAGKTYVKGAVGFFHGAALRNDGQIVAWGASQPVFTVTQQATILTVPALPAGVVYTDLGVGYRTTIALRSDGQLRGWGISLYGDLDIPALPAGTTWTQVSLAGTFAVGLGSDGVIRAWGDDYFGQVTAKPVAPAGQTFVEIRSGADHALARRSDGTWVGWGTNYDQESNGQLVPSGSLSQLIASGGFNVTRHPVVAACPGDLDQSTVVDAGDIGSLLILFGDCAGGTPGCEGDLDGSATVDAGDIGSLLLMFGDCP